jgi:glutamate carboxypeptidase
MKFSFERSLTDPNQISRTLKELSWLDQQQTPMLDLIQRLCNQNSGTLNLSGIRRVGEILQEAFAPLEAELQIVPSQPYQTIDDQGKAGEQPLGESLWFRKWPAAERRVLLCIHCDTVYDLNSPFQLCRWLENGTLNGPGVADAKGGLVMMLYSLKMLERSSMAGKLGWDVLINPDEEIGSPGSQSLIRQIAPHCQFGLLFEPALPDGTLISWRKGVGNFTFVVQGRSAHSGRDFDKGRNAIVALAQLLSQIDGLNTDPELTFNVGRVSGGGALNVVPDLAIGRVNVRVKTTEQSQQVLNEFQRLLDRWNQRDGIQVQLHGDFSSPPKMLTPQVEILQRRIEDAAAILGIPLGWQGSGGGSDGNKFADAGLPNIDSLGPCGGNIHSFQEFLIPDSLIPRTKLAALTLMSYVNHC